MAPKLVSVQERYYSTYVEYQLSATRQRYRIPARCIGSRILDVTMFASTFEYRLARLHPTENTRIEFGFWIDNRDIVVSQNVAMGSGVLRIYYQLRPSTMATSGFTSTTVSGVSSSVITASISLSGAYDIYPSSGLGQVTVPNVSFPGAASAGQPSDWVQGVDLTNFASVGDKVTTAGFTDVVPLPQELHDVLAFRCAMRIKQMQGLSNDYVQMKEIYEEVEMNALNLISPRSENAEKSIRPLDLLGWGY